MTPDTFSLTCTSAICSSETQSQKILPILSKNFRSLIPTPHVWSNSVRYRIKISRQGEGDVQVLSVSVSQNIITPWRNVKYSNSNNYSFAKTNDPSKAINFYWAVETNYEISTLKITSMFLWLAFCYLPFS